MRSHQSLNTKLMQSQLSWNSSATIYLLNGFEEIRVTIQVVVKKADSTELDYDVNEKLSCFKSEILFASFESGHATMKFCHAKQICSNVCLTQNE